MTLSALLFPFVVYLLIAFLGYRVERGVSSNFFLAMDDAVIGRTLFSFIYISFLAMILLSFPLKFFQGRNVLIWLLNVMTGNRLSTKNTRFGHGEEEDDELEPLTRS
jgi:hypothetical protein